MFTNVIYLLILIFSISSVMYQYFHAASFSLCDYFHLFFSLNGTIKNRGRDGGGEISIANYFLCLHMLSHSLNRLEQNISHKVISKIGTQLACYIKVTLWLIEIGKFNFYQFLFFLNQQNLHHTARQSQISKINALTDLIWSIYLCTLFKTISNPLYCMILFLPYSNAFIIHPCRIFERMTQDVPRA